MAIIDIFNSGDISVGFHNFVISLIAIVTALSVHEFAHAYAATKLGDPTPKRQGRLTLNPAAHLDTYGFILIALVGLGWGRPVEFDPSFFKSPRKHTSLVAFAGPLSNILMAILTAIIITVFNLNLEILSAFLFINITLAFFNLIPLYPLDGFNILSGILPINLAWQFEETRKYGIIVLIALMLTGQVTKILTFMTFAFLGILNIFL